jgi:ElaB/YqjD/DUF883 family membrane-anchored ribosome-binding protein
MSNEQPVFNDIADRVEKFYSKLIFQIIGLLAVVVGLIGLLIPFVANYYQQQSFEERKALIKQELRSELQVLVQKEHEDRQDQIAAAFKAQSNSMNSLLKTQTDDVNKGYKELYEKTNKELTNQLETVNKLASIIDNNQSEANTRSWAGVYSLRAEIGFQNQNYAQAFVYYCRAASQFKKISEERNMQASIETLRRVVIPQLNKRWFEIDSDMTPAFDELIKTLTDENKGAIYTLLIENLKMEVANAKSKKG